MSLSLRRKELPEPLPSVRLDIREAEKAYARLFSTPDGQKVLAHLSAVTFMRAAPADASDWMLRHMEGQRALLASILRMIDRGKTN